jgi:hypothetical protein
MKHLNLVSIKPAAAQLQLLIFRQDAPVISLHLAHSAAEPYRASGLVLWVKADFKQDLAANDL